ncbi:MAG: PIG-L family deacetylase, partial [Betaproteobacteria bacterium]
MFPRLRRALTSLAVCAALAAGASLAPAEAPLVPLDFDRGACGTGLALRRVGVSGRVLYVTAHPDDENNGVLVRLSRGLGLRTALLTLTRGEGGQNAIGPELFEALGVLRTEELLALHRYDAVEQYFGRAYEFGFSFSVEETFAKWGHDETLGDVVRVVRAFRPDVMLTLPLTGAGGGQHHQAAGRLAAEAFRAAADPTRFPEQLGEGLRPWQASKIYVGGVGGGSEGLGGAPPVRLPTGVYDPLLGMTWAQIGSRARAMHRCQMSAQLVADPGPAEGVYTLLDAEPRPQGPETDILQGVDTTLRGLARFAPSGELPAALASLQAQADAARAAFDAAAPEKAVPALAEALSATRALRHELEARVPEASARAEIGERLDEEAADVEEALARAEGVVLEARADDGLVTPGQAFGVVVSVWNQATRPMDLQEVAVDVPRGWSAVRRDGEPGPLPAGGPRRLHFTVQVAEDARVSQPYWR